MGSEGNALEEGTVPQLDFEKLRRIAERGDDGVAGELIRLREHRRVLEVDQHAGGHGEQHCRGGRDRGTGHAQRRQRGADQPHQERRGQEGQRRGRREQVVAQLPLGRREDEDRGHRPAQEEAGARIA